MNPASLRSRILAQRRALTAEQIAAQSRRTVEKFLTLLPSPEIWKGLHVGLYRALPDELSLDSLERYLVHSGAQVLFPRVWRSKDPNEKSLEFVPMGANGSVDWTAGPYGVHEPRPGLPAADPSTLDLIVLPGVAFGKNGERLGMGAGYYDRFLARVPSALRVVLAFDFQLLDWIEQQKWDQPVDWIVTESEEIRRDRAQAWLEKFTG